jgi:hypothetical protein
VKARTKPSRREKKKMREKETGKSLSLFKTLLKKGLSRSLVRFTW